MRPEDLKWWYRTSFKPAVEKSFRKGTISKYVMEKLLEPVHFLEDSETLKSQENKVIEETNGRR